MSFIYAEDVKVLYTKSDAEVDDTLTFFSDGNIKVSEQGIPIYSRFNCINDETFEKWLINDLQYKYITSNEYMSRIHTDLVNFMEKHQRKKATNCKTVNINDIVKIKLKPEGVDIYYHQYDELIAKGLLVDRPMPVIDEQGYTKMQLWEVMQLFGPKLSLGAGVPFETDIVLED